MAVLRSHIPSQDRGSRWVICGVLLIALALFFHFRELPLRKLILGSPADRYVVAQVDFTFQDTEKTELMRREAARDIGAVYRVDPHQIFRIQHQFEQELANPSFREQLGKATFEQAYVTLDAFVKTFVKSRYAGARTFQKMKEMHAKPVGIYKLNKINLNGEVTLPKNIWEEISQKAFASKESRSAQEKKTEDFIVQYFSGYSWELHEDNATSRSLSRQIEARIPEQFTSIDEGTIFLSPQETVTMQHIVMLKAMRAALSKKQNLWSPYTWAGSLLFACIFVGLGYLYLRTYKKNILYSLQKMTLLCVIIVLTLALAKAAEFLLMHQGGQWLDRVDYPLFLPFATVLICILVEANVALFLSAALLVILSVCLTFDTSHFLVTNAAAACITMMCAKGIHKRREVFAVCGKTWIFVLVIIIAFSLSEDQGWYIAFIAGGATSFLSLLATAILAVGLLPILENIFHVVTDMTLMEYMDPDHELLKRLSLEAPGTYQHSLVVGNLAEAAARAIGADGLFCRVATLYHDIGKLFNPHYFTENQLGGFNIHQLLTPSESAQVIMTHVPEGEALARKKGLPQGFIDVIREHHGTTLVYYFYRKQLELSSTENVDEQLFRYPGPKPRSKESAIIMIADTVEAASRSAQQLSEESLTTLVNKLVSEKGADGQLDECQLTFEELGIVKKAMVKALIFTSHLRVKYPEKPLISSTK